MDVIAEYAPDVFSVMLPGAGVGGTVVAAERLRIAVASCTLPLGGGGFQFNISTGAAEATAPDTLETLENRAEEALAKAVHFGGNCSYLHDGTQCEPASSMLERIG